MASYSTAILVGIALLLLLALQGCGQTQYGNIARSVVTDRGAEVADEGLANAEWFVCSAATIGSVKRKYGVSRERAEAYNRFCPDTSGARVIEGPEAK